MKNFTLFLTRLLQMSLLSSLLSPVMSTVLAGEAKLVSWNDLVPVEYHSDNLVAKYADELKKLETLPIGSPETTEIMDRINAEINSAPMNEAINGKKIRLPGYISPLDVHQGLISRFLLVPYFGACIHVPPPPLNQTVLVIAEKGQEIEMEKIESPYEITGTIQISNTQTEIGGAGYVIKHAQSKKIREEDWESYQ